jgi:6-phosphogluconolactonase
MSSCIIRLFRPCLLLVGSLCLGLSAVEPANSSPAARVYLSGGGAPTITACTLNPIDGSLQVMSTTQVGGGPNFLAWSPDQRMVYAVSSTDGKGQVIVCQRDPQTGNLTRLEEVATGGKGPCYIAVHPTGRWLYVAHYGSGQVSLLPIAADGRPAPATQVITAGIKAHMTMVAPDGRFLFVPCLGDDAIKIFRIDPATGELTPNQPACAAVPAGAGPRHIAFHPNRKWAYVINELAATVTSFAYDATNGVLSDAQTISSLPADYTGRKWGAHILVAADGRHLYVSNRSHDSIAILALNQETGRPTLVANETGNGELKTPRNFTIDPSGTLALVASQDGDRLTTFRIDPASGLLTRLASMPTSKGPSFIGVMAQP